MYAPVTLKNSRYVASLGFTSRRPAGAIAAEPDVPRTPIRLTPRASANVSPIIPFSIGTRRTPPPMPTRAPRKPASIPANRDNNSSPCIRRIVLHYDRPGEVMSLKRTAVWTALLAAALTTSACQKEAPKDDAAAGGHAHYAAAGPDKPNADGQVAPRLQNLGNYAFPVSTKNEQAQKFINQGLNLSYAFNH